MHVTVLTFKLLLNLFSPVKVGFLSPFLLCVWIWYLIVLSSCNSIQVKFNHANIFVHTPVCGCVGLECEVTAITF
jgi:hypothetical protein